MRFKDYRNPHTNDNRIYSYTDLYNMPFGELIKNKKEILGQYRVLGVPTEKELQGSDNVVYVESYTRDDGTEVKAHYRSKPGGSISSRTSEPKVKTEKEEDNSQGSPTDAASDVKQEEVKQDNLKIQDKDLDTKTKKEKMMYPDEVAGVKRGEPKTFEQMMQQGVNPKLNSEEDIDGRYSKNCACCTFAALLVQRGYDVEAGAADAPLAEEIKKADKTPYLDPETGEECVPQKINIDEVNCSDFLDKNVKQGECYEFSYYTQRDLFYGESSENAYNNQKTDGHVVLLTRDNENKLLWYDPQDGTTHTGNDAKDYINSWVNERTLFDPRILRVK